MLKITEEAYNKILEIAKNEGIDTPSLRIRIVGGGCAGFKQDMEFEDSPLDTDEIVKIKDISFFIDQVSAQYLEGCMIDYYKSSIQEGFKFNNPNTQSTCGCGKSFSF